MLRLLNISSFHTFNIFNVEINITFCANRGHLSIQILETKK
jgi:hypothetical protein